MERRRLGASDLTPSVLGLGALHFGVYLDEAAATHLVHLAIDRGVDFIDTAPLYGNGRSEAIVGKALEGRRADVLIATKVGLAPTTNPDGTFAVRTTPLRAGEIRASLERSLHALRADHIDLFYAHAFDRTTPLDETLETFDRLVTEGKIRAWASSNYSPDELSAAVAVASAGGSAPMAAAQVHYNLIERRAGESLATLAADAGISLICNRALARGILTGKYRPGTAPPPESRGGQPAHASAGGSFLRH